MANVRTTNKDARLLEQSARGRRIRNVAFQPVILALDRTGIDADSHVLATVIDGETSAVVPIMIAPCEAKIVRTFANAVTYATTSGAATVTFSKAVIGGTDVALNTAIDVDNPTDETTIDGVLSTTTGALDLLNGQLVYATVALSATTSAISDGMIIGVEWVPMDAPSP